jgi:hypothetical protein
MIFLVARSADAQFRSAQSTPWQMHSKTMTEMEAEALDDSLARAYCPSLGDAGLQFVGAEVGFNVPFWISGGTRNMDGFGILGATIGVFIVPLCIKLTTNWIHPNRGTYWWGLLGSLAGFGLGTSLLYSYVFQTSQNLGVKYISLALPMCILGVLFFDIALLLRDR